MLASWFRPLKRGRKNGSTDILKEERKVRHKSKAQEASSVGVGLRVVVVDGHELTKDVHKGASASAGKGSASGVEGNDGQLAKKGHQKVLRRSAVDVGSVKEQRRTPRLEVDPSGHFESLGIDTSGASPAPPPPSLSTTPVRHTHSKSIAGDSGIDVNSKKSTTSSTGSASLPESPSAAASDGDSEESDGSSKNDESDTITVVSKAPSNQFKAVLADEETDRICESPTESVSPEPEIPQPRSKPARKRKALPNPPSMPTLGGQIRPSSSAAPATRAMDKRASITSVRPSLSGQTSPPVLDVFIEAAAARMDLFNDISIDIPPPKPVPSMPTQNNAHLSTDSFPSPTAAAAVPKPHPNPTQRNKRFSFIDTASGTASALPPSAGGRRGMGFGLGRKRDSILMAVEESGKGESFVVAANHRLSSLLEHSNRSSYTGLPRAPSTASHPSTRHQNAPPETSHMRQSNRDRRQSSRGAPPPERSSSSTTTYTMPAKPWYLPSSPLANDYSPAAARRNLCAGIPIVLPGVYYGKKIGVQDDTTTGGPKTQAAAFELTKNKTVQGQQPLEASKPTHRSMPTLSAPLSTDSSPSKPKPEPTYVAVPTDYGEAGPSEPRVFIIDYKEPDIDAIMPVPEPNDSRKAYDPVPNPKWKGKGKGKGKESVNGVLVGVRA